MVLIKNKKCRDGETLRETLTRIWVAHGRLPLSDLEDDVVATVGDLLGEGSESVAQLRRVAVELEGRPNSVQRDHRCGFRGRWMIGS